MSKAAPVRLRCEHLVDPLGIDVLHPRLSWELSDDGPGARQSAYRISVSRGSESDGDLWDSGWVDSDQSILVPYGGVPLISRMRAYWKVQVRDGDGMESEWSDSASFEVGLLDRADWVAEWIGSEVCGGPRTTAPAVYLRRTVEVRGGIVKARAYVTALGLYVLTINGVRIGDQQLAPGWTDYTKRVRYQVFDVTANLSEGPNAIGAILGDGWYAGHIGWRDRGVYGDRPRLFAQIEVVYEDGSIETVATNETWKTSVGPILESDLLMGESYDARKELGEWDKAGYDDREWGPVLKLPDPGIQLVATMQPPIRVTQEVVPIDEPKVLPSWPGADYIFDLGQNMVGRARFRLKGKPGETIRIRYAEILDEQGKIYTANLRGARATDYYTFKSSEEEVYEPTFTFHGFRYVELKGLSSPADRHSVVGIVMHSDNEEIGTFECSDPLVNQLQSNIVWGWKGNSLDVPTDCPQRDERLGWTGDAQVFVRTAAFNMNVAAFFEKFSQDLSDAQSSEGGIPAVAPNVDIVGIDGGPAWADAAVICPWTIYLTSGDQGILEKHYESMKRFVEFLDARSKDGMRSWPGMEGFHGFGDWLSINADTSIELIGTAFFAYSADLMVKIATVLGKVDDADGFGGLRDKAKDAFQRYFVSPMGRVASETQTAYLLGLHFDLLPEHLRPAAVDSLVRDIKRRGNKLSAGFVGSPYLNHVLSKEGRDDVAFDLLNQKDWPSWLYAVTKGATTIWERWDGWTHDKGFQDVGMNSFNHYAYGAIGAWLYQNVAGIDVSESGPGYKRSVLHPTPGGGLTYARASVHTPYGVLSSAWKVEGDLFEWQFTVPPNTTAEVRVPGERSHVLAPDTLKFVSQEGDRAVFEAAAGTYKITSNKP